MNFAFSEDQDMIRKSAADFVKGESSIERIRELHEGELGYSKELYGRMAESGWLGCYRRVQAADSARGRCLQG